MMTVNPPTKSVRVEEKAVLTMEVSDVTRVVTIAWAFRRVPGSSSLAIFLSRRFPLPAAQPGGEAFPLP